jgi:hypothetical protein
MPVTEQTMQALIGTLPSEESMMKAVETYNSFAKYDAELKKAASKITEMYRNPKTDPKGVSEGIKTYSEQLRTLLTWSQERITEDPYLAPLAQQIGIDKSREFPDAMTSYLRWLRFFKDMSVYNKTDLAAKKATLEAQTEATNKQIEDAGSFNKLYKELYGGLAEVQRSWRSS